MQKKKGISLIVLVITIIVMVILAGAIILTLNNSGIINKASGAVEETNLATVKEVASLAWAEAYTDGARTQEDLEDAVMEALDDIKVDTTKYTITVTENGVDIVRNEGNGEVTPPVLDPALNHSGVIPEGGRYLTGATMGSPTGDFGITSDKYYVYTAATELTAGQAFPTEVQNGDKYYYGNYVYVYNGIEGQDVRPGGENFYSTEINGWHVSAQGFVTGGVSNPGSVLESINGMPIVDMSYTFYNCTSLEVVPKIPATVTDISGIFYIIPGGMDYSDTIRTYEGSVDADGDFSNYIIPNSVTNMNYMFSPCSTITKAPVIPSSVKNMENAFAGCIALVGSIEVNANPTDYVGCLAGTQITEITGSTTLKTEILATKT